MLFKRQKHKSSDLSILSVTEYLSSKNTIKQTLFFSLINKPLNMFKYYLVFDISDK